MTSWHEANNYMKERDDELDEYHSKCCVCGDESVDEVEGEPVCGKFRCGLRVQSAADYHHERGG